MKPAYTVGFLTCVKSEYTHGEAFIGIGILTAHIHEVGPGDSEFCGELMHILAKQVFVEIVMTGRHGSVYGI